MGGTRNCFLIMPFRQDLEWLRRDVLAAGQLAGFQVQRADDIFAPGSILEQILQAIDAADVVVCVCTGRNANVYFELGHAWRRHSPVLLAESAQDLPSDFAHYRAIVYDPSPSLDHDDLIRQIAAHMTAAADARPLPVGHRLAAAPARKSAVRLSANLHEAGRNSHWFVISNTGTVDVQDVNVSIPEEIQGLQLHRQGELPVPVLRPGERAKIMASVLWDGGPRLFDATLTGHTEDGTAVEIPAKINL